MQSGSISSSDFLNNTATAGQGGGVYFESVIADVINTRCDTMSDMWYYFSLGSPSLYVQHSD